VQLLPRLPLARQPPRSRLSYETIFSSGGGDMQPLYNTCTSSSTRVALLYLVPPLLSTRLSLPQQEGSPSSATTGVAWALDAHGVSDDAVLGLLSIPDLSSPPPSGTQE